MEDKQQQRCPWLDCEAILTTVPSLPSFCISSFFSILGSFCPACLPEGRIHFCECIRTLKSHSSMVREGVQGAGENVHMEMLGICRRCFNTAPASQIHSIEVTIEVEHDFGGTEKYCQKQKRSSKHRDVDSFPVLIEQCWDTPSCLLLYIPSLPNPCFSQFVLEW